MVITAITINAPMSGSSSNRIDTKPAPRSSATRLYLNTRRSWFCARNNPPHKYTPPFHHLGRLKIHKAQRQPAPRTIHANPRGISTIINKNSAIKTSPARVLPIVTADVECKIATLKPTIQAQTMRIKSGSANNCETSANPAKRYWPNTP